MLLREIKHEDVYTATRIWNSIVEAGNAFPQTDTLTADEADKFFFTQTYTGVAEDDLGNVVGLYILHPNNVGRCGHICNASFAVETSKRGQGIGEALVRDCIKKGKQKGFEILMFNAVCVSNTAALALYKKLGFKQLGTVPRGYRRKDGKYEDIIIHIRDL